MTSLRTMLLAAGLVVLVGAIACDGDADGGPSTPTTNPDEPTATATTDSSGPTPTATESPQDETPTPSSEAPAAPGDVTLSGPLPDLNTPVPPGQGELGRLTVEWIDNADDEDGFRVYQECEGARSVLLEVGADETSYGPFQACRPGRVGVAAFNTAGESEIAWAVPAPSAGAPAAPSDVTLSGPLPDLNTPVPPGQGEQGRLTIEWTDNADDEDGFRVYQECEGTQSVLLEVGADETSYGPFQACRPGRAGVPAFNATGESEIAWAP